MSWFKTSIAELRSIQKSIEDRRERVRDVAKWLYAELLEEHAHGLNEESIRNFARLSIQAAVVFEDELEKELGI